MHVPKCYYLHHFEARMSQNAIIYSTSEPHDADILLFARHCIRLFVVPSQYGVWKVWGAFGGLGGGL